jgi:archaeosine synthase
MGIDFFDNSLAYLISKKGYFVLEDKIYPLNNHPKCYCPYCSQENPNIFGHNELVMKNEISKVRFTLEEGSLRELVEKDIHRSVTFAATLKHVDKNHSDFIRKRIPMILSSKLICIGEESLYHPIISEYRERIRTRFKPSSEKKLVLLLPCSARKPYSFSRSHMQFRNAIKKAGKRVFSLLSEIIITSPLSVVPRELEGIYPTKFYDIPVAGRWSEEEIAITADLLLDVLSRYSKDTVIINHMHGHGYDQIIEIVKTKQSLRVIDTSKENHPSNYESLNKLSEVLNTVTKDLEKENVFTLPQKIKTLQATADYQYGAGTGEILFSRNIKIKGKYPRNLQIFRDKQNIATLSSRTGFLSVSPHIAQEIIDLSLNKLEFGADYVSGSNIYAPGCICADKTIHPNDEIFIIHDNRVIATAIAFVSGNDMNNMTSGSLAEVKKKLKVSK